MNSSYKPQPIMLKILATYYAFEQCTKMLPIILSIMPISIAIMPQFICNFIILMTTLAYLWAPCTLLYGSILPIMLCCSILSFFTYYAQYYAHDLTSALFCTKYIDNFVVIFY